MRPEQKALAERIGANWSDFALISPDIWRKQLLDYSSLGAAYKYAGACTGEELRIIDHKLDRYMARKAEARAISHLLIDRFRFDSFAPASDEPGSNLLTRFGHTVYLFFIITPPGEIVERAWRRGLEFGRYKAVDDLLAHNIEAYSGMPQLFFTWALRADKEVHLEFLDNTVPFGSRPRTVAFGWNGELNVLDVKSMLDVQRFREWMCVPQVRTTSTRTRTYLRRRTIRAFCSSVRAGFPGSTSPIRRRAASISALLRARRFGRTPTHCTRQ